MAVSHQVVSNWRGEIQFLCFQDQCFQSVVCLWTACYWDPQWEGFKIRESFQKLLQFSSITQSFLTLCDPWTAARQASLSITNSWSLFKPISIKLVMPSNHLILCRPLLLLPSIFPSTRPSVFPNESALYIRWPKCWIFSFSISPFNEYSGLISFRIDWLDLLEV